MRQLYKTSLITLSFLLSQSAASATFSPLPPGVFDVNARVELLSNYVWRGISQSDNNPSVEGGLTLTHKVTDIYGALDIATIERTDHHGENSSIEMLTALGLKGPLFEAQYDTKWLYYYYPDAIGLGWNEFLASVQYDWVNAGISFSTNALNSASTGWYMHVDAKWQLPENSYFVAPPDFYLLGKVGRYLFNRGRYNGLNYTDYLIGVEKNFDKQFVASGILTATNRNFQGGGLDEMHLVFRLGASF
jgi:uncharacterized protein (TIGR02001 family)